MYKFWILGIKYDADPTVFYLIAIIFYNIGLSISGDRNIKHP